MACDGRNVITMINAGANSYNNDTWGRRRINQTIVIIFWHKYINYFLFVSHISSFLTVHIVVNEGRNYWENMWTKGCPKIKLALGKHLEFP